MKGGRRGTSTQTIIMNGGAQQVCYTKTYKRGPSYNDLQSTGKCHGLQPTYIMIPYTLLRVHLRTRRQLVGRGRAAEPLLDGT